MVQWSGVVTLTPDQDLPLSAWMPGPDPQGKGEGEFIEARSDGFYFMHAQKITKAEKIPYTIVANAPMFDARLSLKAKGLYAYMYAKPEGWDFAAKRIAKESDDGRLAVLSAMRELVAAGYVTKRRLGSGRIEYVLWCNPQSSNRTEAKHESCPQPSVMKPHGAVSARCGLTLDNKVLNDKQILKEIKYTRDAGDKSPSRREKRKGEMQSIGTLLEHIKTTV